jgi:hypothetical protein
MIDSIWDYTRLQRSFLFVPWLVGVVGAVSILHVEHDKDICAQLEIPILHYLLCWNEFRL